MKTKRVDLSRIIGSYRSFAALVILLCAGCATTASNGNPVVKVGKKVILLATADGTPPFTFKWEKDGQPVTTATGDRIVIERAQLSDSGSYTCVVSNALGETTVRHELVVVAR